MSKEKEEQKNYFKYWGKAKRTEKGNIEYHPLYLHSLDVVAVASEWWKHSVAVRRSFVQETNLSEEQIYGCIQFFIALHDLGKLDIRFQNKVPEISPYNTVEVDTKNYDHGKSGFIWFVQESKDILNGCNNTQQRHLQNWLAHTAGHHGTIPKDAEPITLPSYIQDEIKEQDRLTRKQFIQDMAKLFLKPKGVHLNNINLPENPPLLLAGFCAVCDWLGSNTDYFKYAKLSDIKYSQQFLSSWYESKKMKAREILRQFGLLTTIISQGGMKQIFPNFQERNVQTLIPKMEVTPGLVIMEASTGSGKTEAAMAFASQLLAKGFADSITFALPTQATTNAILPRLTDASEKIFSSGKNVILAHGRSPYNENFKQLIKNSFKQINACGNEAGAQCHEWLSLSRKRAFLGQIAVTTVDQVMLSAIKSLKHYFVRGFGIGKSVLIIDEIHAYDSYMYGLLKKVIQQQKKAGGSAILLSATLPWYQKKKLLEIWKPEKCEQAKVISDYPLILQIFDSADSKLQKKYSNSMTLNKHNKKVKTPVRSNFIRAFTLKEKEKCKKVLIDLWSNNNMCLEENNLKKITAVSMEKEIKIGIICNLVNDAQNIAKQLKVPESSVDIFHSRYRYKDRMKKEKLVIEQYGKNSNKKSAILVGTQVLEQSLDIDFDWLITFLCPVDLMFQRMGRLHRHSKQRPKDFEKPLCSIILPEKEKMDYKNHIYIYRNKRALWRTQQLLYKKKPAGCVVFPLAYREWIERVYQEESWNNEPTEITQAFEEYKEQFIIASELTASSLTEINTFHQDTEGNATTLTREGEMNLTVVPVIEQNQHCFFLDGKNKVPSSKDKDKKQWETLYQNSILVPASWERFIPEHSQTQNKLYYLTMQKTSSKNEWFSHSYKGVQFHYTVEYGLQKIQTLS